VPAILPPVDGFLLLDKAKFAAAFAADVRPDLAYGGLAGPLGRGSPDGKVTAPAWKVRPSWYLASTADRMISYTSE
jgi:hypothetical protein